MCFLLRLLPANTRIYNIVIDGLIDVDRVIDHPHGGTLLLGDGGTYGTNQPDSMSAVTINNVICASNQPIVLAGFMRDSSISNIINHTKSPNAVIINRENGAINVAMSNLVNAPRA